MAKVALAGGLCQSRKPNHPGRFVSLYQAVFCVPALSTGQNLQGPQEFLEFLGQVQGDVAEEVESVAEQGLEGALKCFLKRMGFCSWSNWPVL